MIKEIIIVLLIFVLLFIVGCESSYNNCMCGCIHIERNKVCKSDGQSTNGWDCDFYIALEKPDLDDSIEEICHNQCRRLN